MKRLFMCCIAAASFLATSCIFDAPGDKFYRTVWYSDEVPLGPFEVESLTLEFLCNDEVSIRLSGISETTGIASDDDTAPSDSAKKESARLIYGRYHPDEETAVFENIVTNLRNLDITFVEAHHSGETLFLLWRIENSVYPFTTALHRRP